jgi:deferrochelatase/peroxidase EfeB
MTSGLPGLDWKPYSRPEAEFDDFARDYDCTHQTGVGDLAEQPGYFFEYKVRDAHVEALKRHLPTLCRSLTPDAAPATRSPT